MAQNIEGCSVFALVIFYDDVEEEELWGIYSNAKACCDNGEKICAALADKGVTAKYRCRSYDVKGE